jgi:hypothetical protein
MGIYASGKSSEAHGGEFANENDVLTADDHDHATDLAIPEV